MATVNPTIDPRAFAAERLQVRLRKLAENWQSVTSPEPPEVPAEILVEDTIATIHRNAWRAGYARAMRDCAIELRQQLKGGI